MRVQFNKLLWRQALKSYSLVLISLFIISGCASSPTFNEGIEMLTSSSIPKNCEIVDSFEVHAENQIKSFYSLTKTDLPSQINVALYNEEEHSKFERQAWKEKEKKAAEEYFAKNPGAKSLPLDFGSTPIAYRYTDKNIKHFYGVLLSCSNE